MFIYHSLPLPSNEIPFPTINTTASDSNSSTTTTSENKNNNNNNNYIAAQINQSIMNAKIFPNSSNNPSSHSTNPSHRFSGTHETTFTYRPTHHFGGISHSTTTATTPEGAAPTTMYSIPHPTPPTMTPNNSIEGAQPLKIHHPITSISIAPHSLALPSGFGNTNKDTYNRPILQNPPVAPSAIAMKPNDLSTNSSLSSNVIAHAADVTHMMVDLPPNPNPAAKVTHNVANTSNTMISDHNQNTYQMKNPSSINLNHETKNNVNSNLTAKSLVPPTNHQPTQNILYAPVGPFANNLKLIHPQPSVANNTLINNSVHVHAHVTGSSPIEDPDHSKVFWKQFPAVNHPHHVQQVPHTAFSIKEKVDLSLSLSTANILEDSVAVLTKMAQMSKKDPNQTANIDNHHESIKMDELYKRHQRQLMSLREESMLVRNDPALALTAYESEKNQAIGSILYKQPKSLVPGVDEPELLNLFLLPRFFAQDMYNTINIYLPYTCLSYYHNPSVRAQAVWGTEVYTDDSDIFSAIIHSGFYVPFDHPKHIIQLGNTTEFLEHGVKMNGQWSPPLQPLYGLEDVNDGECKHDLKVTIRILPKLQRYSPSTNYGLTSRGWGVDHDGESFRIEKVEVLPKAFVYTVSSV